MRDGDSYDPSVAESRLGSGASNQMRNLRYSNWRPLGEGGTAQVFRAFDTELGYDVAIKILKKDVIRNAQARAMMIQGLRNEVRISRMLRHEYICAIHDLFDGPQGVGIVMDIIEGCELRDWMKEHKGELTKTAPQRLSFLRKITEALVVAHKRIVHRDLKPQNIFLKQNDILQPVIMDFGFSVVGETVGTNDPQAFTPKYMAPEQFSAPDRVDRRADLFALGIMSYELFTNRVPPNSLQDVTRTRTPPRIPLEMIKPPSAYCPVVPPALDRLILQLTAYEPDRRIQTAGEVLETLREIELCQSPDSVLGAERKNAAIAIPGGEYYLGSRAAHSSYRNELPGKPIKLSPFKIDAAPVTNQDYANYALKAGLPMGPLMEHVVLGRPDHPVVGLTYAEAMAFAQAAGGSLPTEAQWECAARGGTKFLEYPWGSEPPSATRANLDGVSEVTSPVYAFPGGRNAYGLWDMCGNVWEWCVDYYDPDFYRSLPKNAKDPVNGKPPGGTSSEAAERSLRGGSFQSFKTQGRCAFRASAPPGERRNDVGFRVCYNQDDQ